jgi:NTE family protein
VRATSYTEPKAPVRIDAVEPAVLWGRLVPRVAELRSGTPNRCLSLALQGGGSFGTFNWGVLDRLLQEDSLALDMISGTSAGAVNAVIQRSRK